MPGSNYFNDATLNFWLRNDPDTLTAPATVYLGLWEATLDATSTGTTAGEVSGGAGPYARQAVAFDDPAGASSTDSSAAETFSGMPSASVTDWAICDASSNGNILVYGKFDNTITVTSGNDLTFAAADITALFT